MEQPLDPTRPSVIPHVPADVDESWPALGRRSTLIEQQRQESGGLPEDPEDPVINDNPFRPKGGR